MAADKPRWGPHRVHPGTGARKQAERTRRWRRNWARLLWHMVRGTG